jgi:RIO kinase 1
MPRINLNNFLDDDFDQEKKQPRFKVVRRSSHAILDEKATIVGLSNLGAEEVFRPSINASHHEREWIFTYLGPFYDNKLIVDVIRRVKGGKEANVYLCKAHPDVAYPYLAAKIYRPRMFRSLRNDTRYRDRRTVLDERGKKVTDPGALRALHGGTSFGQELRQVSWLQYEYQALRTLSAANLPVPHPIASGENTILMEYIGDTQHPAPALNETTLDRKEAHRIFEILMAAIESMLSFACIHADLSAYNVLYWENRPVIIDFPQAIDPRQNPDAWPIFARDVERICQHFRRYGIVTTPMAEARSIWNRYSQTLHPITAEELDPFSD